MFVADMRLFHFKICLPGRQCNFCQLQPSQAEGSGKLVTICPCVPSFMHFACLYRSGSRAKVTDAASSKRESRDKVCEIVDATAFFKKI